MSSTVPSLPSGMSWTLPGYEHNARLCPSSPGQKVIARPAAIGTLLNADRIRDDLSVTLSSRLGRSKAKDKRSCKPCTYETYVCDQSYGITVPWRMLTPRLDNEGLMPYSSVLTVHNGVHLFIRGLMNTYLRRYPEVQVVMPRKSAI